MVTSLNKKNKLRLQAAISYSNRGWAVFPCYAVVDGRCTCIKKGNCTDAGKHPRTVNGLSDATTDVKQIDRWWTKMPQANVAILTGKKSGIWVLDADGAEGIKAVADLESKYGKLPRTPMARSGGGGRHYYFAWPDATVKNSIKLCGLPVDVRGNRGYAIAPPSNHTSGNDYEWEVSPDDVDVAAAPDWLVEFVTTRKPPAAKASDGVMTPEPASAGKLVLRIQDDLDLATHPGVPEGERHSKALALIGAHLSRGDDPAKIVEQALAWAGRCEPPMPEEEMRRIVKDLTTKEKQRSAASCDGWDLPTRFDGFDLPLFPSDALPTWLRDFVEAEAVATQTPIDLPGMLSMATLATACAKKIEVCINAGYREPCNLYVAVALPPGNRKSAVFTEMIAPVREFERAANEAAAPDIARAKNEARIEQTRLQQLQKDAAAVDLAPEDRDMLVQQANELAEQIETMEVPTAPRLVTADTTPEALTTLLAENKGRMAVMSPEGDLFDIISGRYARGTPHFAVYLLAHAGDDLRVDRSQREPEFVRAPALTIGLTVQPDVVVGLGSKHELRGRGLLARFLYAVPRSLVGRRDPNPPAMNDEVRQAYQLNLNSLLELTAPVNDDGESEPYRLLLSPEAEAARIAFATWLEPMLGDGGELGTIQDWAAKLSGAILRIAGLLHMAENVGQKAPWSKPISGATMTQAVRIGHYLVAHARAAFDLMGTDPMTESAKAVLAWIERRQQKFLSEREIFEGTKGRFKRVDELRPVLNLLVAHNYLRMRLADPRTGPGRKPGPVYEVNPRIASHNSQNSQNVVPSGDFANNANIANDFQTEAPVPTSAIGKLRIAADDEDDEVAATAVVDGDDSVEEGTI